jgi:hypothetical protein
MSEFEDIPFGDGQPLLPLPTSAPPARTDSQATRLVDIAESFGVQLFHDPDRQGYARFPASGHHEISLLRKKQFKDWLRRHYYERHGGAPNAQALQDALGVLEGAALYEGETHAVHTRVAGFNGAIYHDLANEAWEAVEIDGNGWRIVADPPVRFRRPSGLAALPTPTRGGSLDALRPFLNMSTNEDFVLFVGCLVQMFRPRGPYLGYASYGEQGSAKSTRARILKHLIDPGRAPLRSAPRDERDLMVAAQNSWLVTLDNLSRLPDWLSDALCRLMTGGGLGTRQLYTDADEVIFDAQRPVVLNGIEEVAVRGDLLDRVISSRAPRITDAERRDEDDFWSAFDRHHPAIYGALLDAAACALRNLGQVQIERMPRMADAARWVTAAEPAFGWSTGSFIDAFFTSRAEAHQVILESSPLTPILIPLASEGFEGTCTALLDRLNARAEDERRRARAWPKNAQSLSGKLRRLAPALRANGIDIELDNRLPGGTRTRIVTLRAAPHASVPFVPDTPHSASEAKPDGTRGDQVGTRESSSGAAPVPASLSQPRQASEDEAHVRDAGDAGDAGDASPTARSWPSDEDAPASPGTDAHDQLTDEELEREFRRFFPDAVPPAPTREQKRKLVARCLEVEARQRAGQ